jgi:regulator of protease activity HflC (stomatin/prohibitin superfamily)
MRPHTEEKTDMTDTDTDTVPIDAAAAFPPTRIDRLAARMSRLRPRPLVVGAVLVAAAWGLCTHPPLRNVPNGDLGVRMNRLNGEATVVQAGTEFVVPGLHDLRVYDLHEQTFHPADSESAGGSAPFQSVEGLSIGVDIAAHYVLDPARIGTIARDLPADVGGEVVAPAVRGVIYRVFTRYTVREIYSSKRAEIQQVIEGELRPKLAASGILLRDVQIGKVDLPPDYRRGMESLLAEELASEKMRFTLELKDKEVKQAGLEAEADKVRREKGAEAAGQEQIIAAKAQEEAMAHVLPFKQKQIQQRQLEAEADKVSRIKTAEGTAEARRIEASGEADSRNKLADAEVYRMDKVGKSTSEQMAREGELITRHPLLIQKTMADKLSDKVQVIIAPPPADGGFIGSALLGSRNTPAAAPAPAPAPAKVANGDDDNAPQENPQ